ncbi:serine/threonine-protein kinase [Actinomadura sp. KC06]|uniref:serine/threonine-protein kinase n=1 Tax=Actinomadura sp. KC06 TaxID=2530369 RepID=UPI0014042BC7|nr:serine/threonine-protein kinase [Actinomadura sp. KC06]
MNLAAERGGGALGVQAEPGRTVGGRYRLVETLGTGGFGRVWKAHDEALGVQVAVKEVWLPQQSGSEEEHHRRVVRATREARNAARLRDNPHVVAVHDVVVEDGTPWIVMRFVDGCSLEERLRTHGPLPAAFVAEMATALLKALKAAHAAGIVHRDIKPANVMLTDDGQVFLTDFGIAVHETDTRLTASGGVIGSAEYMAPERLNGVHDHAAGDLFSLGVTLYRAVEGVSPFRRDTATATMAAVAMQDPPPMRHADPVLASLITAVLAKRPEDRPTVDSVLALLNAASTLAPPAPAPAPAPTLRAAPPTSVMAPAPRTVYVERLVAGTCFLAAGLGGIAFGCSMYIREGGWVGAYLVGTVAAALVALILGLAATFYRWTGPGRPPFRIVRTVFLAVFLPLSLTWALWNAVLLA